MMNQKSYHNAHSNYRAQGSFGALDGLRCLCILAVVWHHAVPFSDMTVVASRGFLGVDLFFVISGFLIVTLLLRERDSSGLVSLRKFYIRRTLRIFPVYYAILFTLGGYYLFYDNQSEVGEEFLQDFLIYLTYTGNFFFLGWGIVWSLAAEEQFYLVWPQIEKHLTAWFVPIMATSLAINQLFNFPETRSVIAGVLRWPEMTELSIVQATFTPILLGVCVAHMLHNRLWFMKIAPLLCFRVAPLVWLSLLFAVATIPNPDISGFHRLAVHILMAGLVASCVSQEQHILMPVLRFAPIARIGVVSYGVYLFHVHAIIVAESVLIRLNTHYEFAPFILGAVISFVLAELSFRFFEKPFLTLKRRYATVPKQHF